METKTEWAHLKQIGSTSLWGEGNKLSLPVVISSEITEVHDGLGCVGNPIWISPSPIVVVSHIDIVLFDGRVTDDVPHGGVLTETNNTGGSRWIIVPVVVVDRVSWVEITRANCAEVFDVLGNSTNTSTVDVARSVESTVGTFIWWSVQEAVELRGVKVVLAEDWSILAAAELGSASLAHTVSLESLDLLAEKRYLELNIALESKLTANSSLILVVVSVDEYLGSSIVQGSEWVLKWSWHNIANVGVVQAVLAWQLEVVSCFIWGQVVRYVVLEHLKIHTSKDDLVWLSVSSIIKELDVDVANSIICVIFGKSGQW